MSYQLKVTELYNILKARYSVFHQPTFELTLISMCAGNFTALFVILCYISRMKPAIYKLREPNDGFIDCEHNDVGDIYSSPPLEPQGNVTLLKTANTNVRRKLARSKVYFSDMLPVVTAYINKPGGGGGSGGSHYIYRNTNTNTNRDKSH
jgi:hypothetical protein